MAPINQVVQGLSKIVGSSAKVTLGQKQLVQLANKKFGTQAADNIAKLLSKYPNAKATIAYKASERGFTIGAMQIKNGKNIIADGAVSVTGLGGKTAPLIKSKLNIGKNGEIMKSNGWIDFSTAPKLGEIELFSSLKNGVVKINNGMGKAGNSHLRFDTVKAADALGIKAEAGELINITNKMYEDIYALYKKYVLKKNSSKISIDVNPISMY